MSLIHKIFLPFFPELNSEIKASKLQRTQGDLNFPCSAIKQLVYQLDVIGDCQTFLLHKKKLIKDHRGIGEKPCTENLEIEVLWISGQKT